MAMTTRKRQEGEILRELGGKRHGRLLNAPQDNCNRSFKQFKEQEWEMLEAVNFRQQERELTPETQDHCQPMFRLHRTLETGIFSGPHLLSYVFFSSETQLPRCGTVKAESRIHSF